MKWYKELNGIKPYNNKRHENCNNTNQSDDRQSAEKILTMTI